MLGGRTASQTTGLGPTDVPMQAMGQQPNPWQDWSFNSPSGGYDNSPNQAPTPYTNPSPGQYGGAAWDPRTMAFNGAQLPPGTNLPPGMTVGPGGILMPIPQNMPYDPTRGVLNDPTNPNLSSGDITRINRGGPGFMGNGYYINDPSAYRLPQADQMRNAYAQMFEQQQGALDPAAQGQTRGQQQQLANSLFGTLSGKTPSVAEQQLNQTTQGNVANAYAMAAASGNPAMARQAANNAASINQQAVGQGAMLRGQEIQGAQGLLGNVLSGTRSQDIGANQQGGLLGLQSLQGLSGINQQMLQARENLESQQQNAFYGTAGHSIGSQMLGAISSAGSAALSALAHGGVVPGYAKGGDSYKNDKVHAMLSPGEVVLPRSVTKSADAPDKAKRFMEAIRKKHSQKKAA